MLVLGVGVGFAGGLLAERLLRHVCRPQDKLTQVSVLMGLSYLAFWLAELVMGSSAVLAVVFMGFYLNARKAAISLTALLLLPTQCDEN